MNTAPTTPFRARWVTLCLAVALAAIAAAVYAPVRHHDFVSIDDPLYVSENPVVSRGVTWEGVKWAFTTGHAANWHPVTWLSHMADVEAFGMTPGRHHVTSAALHVVNTLLLFLLLKRMTGRAGPSAFVAALFAVHPLHVESVAWIAERKDVLSALFWLLTTWAYVGYVRAKRAGSPPAAALVPAPHAGRETGFYLLMLLLYALGLMAKPMLVTLPLTLLILDWWPLNRLRRPIAGGPEAGSGGPTSAWDARGNEPPDRRGCVAESGAPTSAGDARSHERPERRGHLASELIWEKVPLLVLAAASSLVTFIVQQRGGAVSDLAYVPLAHRAASAVVSCGAYTLKMAWPADLMAFYRYPSSIPVVPLVASALFLAGVTWLAVRTARSRPYLLAGWLWYLVTLAPVVGIVQIGRRAMADRYTYIPLIGIFVMVAWGVRDLAACRLIAAVPARKTAMRGALPVVAVALVAALAVAARAQVGHWADSTSLWTHALNVDPGNYVAHNSLGALASDAGRTEEAIEHFSRAVRFGPDYPEAFNNLGLMYARQGRTAEAVEQYRKALALNPGLAPAHGNLGLALVTLGRMEEALPSYEAAIRLEPGAAIYRSNLGAALYQQGRAADAIAPFTEALKLDPALAQAHTGLGLSLAATNRLEASIPHFEEAARLQPGSDTTRQYLGTALAATGRFDEASTHLREALRINPDNDTAKRALDMIAERTQPPPWVVK